MRRVGFVINSRVPSLRAVGRGMMPHHLATGWNDGGSPMGFMRFGWVAEALRRSGAADYRLYRPGVCFDAVVMLKSMGDETRRLGERLRRGKVPVVFEANVDYYSRPGIEVPLGELCPTPAQRADAIGAAASADGLIASSKRLAEVCRQFNPRCEAVPDNVNFDLVPERVQASPVRDGRLQVWWSGMASKLFEFLSAEDAFVSLKDRIHLHLVTDAPPAAGRWPGEVGRRAEEFFGKVPHTFYKFAGIPDLLRRYSAGGVIVSPRFLDSPYNLAHTEWKITLGMACGMPAVASPIPSYVEAARKGGAGAVEICADDAAWLRAFEGFLREPGRVAEAGAEAAQVVRSAYATPVVARAHLDALERILSAAGRA